MVMMVHYFSYFWHMLLTMVLKQRNSERTLNVDTILNNANLDWPWWWLENKHFFFTRNFRPSGCKEIDQYVLLLGTTSNCVRVTSEKINLPKGQPQLHPLKTWSTFWGKFKVGGNLNKIELTQRQGQIHFKVFSCTLSFPLFFWPNFQFETSLFFRAHST